MKLSKQYHLFVGAPSKNSSVCSCVKALSEMGVLLLRVYHQEHLKVLTSDMTTAITTLMLSLYWYAVRANVCNVLK